VSSAEASTRPRWRRGALLAIGLASSAFFLWLVVRDADLHAVWLALRDAELGPVLLAMVVIQGVYVAQAARWRIIAGTLELSVRRFYALVLGGIGANDVLPLRIGDPSARAGSRPRPRSPPAAPSGPSSATGSAMSSRSSWRSWSRCRS
jgi:uncharacterized membrane protein YbhN (UPF0104 family)